MVGFVVMIVLDMCDIYSDWMGFWLCEQIVVEGYVVIVYVIVLDQISNIQSQLCSWIVDLEIYVIIVIGGIGLMGCDVILEVFKLFYDKEMDGFSVVFYVISFKFVGVFIIQFCVIVGIVVGIYLFVIFGLMGGCKDVWNYVFWDEFDCLYRFCNLVEFIFCLMEC